MHDSRNLLRKELQKARSALDVTTQHAAATAITPHVVTSIEQCRPELANASASRTVASYLSHGGEIDAMPTTLALHSRGWTIVLPVCGANASMEFCPWTPDDELTFNRYGIGEPITAPVAIESIDVVLVPGVGFNTSGSRIGHGVGFYDRFFARCADRSHDPLRLALAHDLQVVDLPTPEPWDVPMHRVLTPTKVIDTTTCA